MKSHDEIREILPDYLQGRLREPLTEEVREHTEACRECKDELALLSALETMEVPDPGDLFWRTLPKKVSAAARPKRRFFRIPSWRLIVGPAFAAVIIVVAISLYLTRAKDKTGPYAEPSFGDPFAVTATDYSDLTESDIPEIAADVAPEELVFAASGGADDNYYREIASLNAGELRQLGERLKEQQGKGG